MSKSRKKNPFIKDKAMTSREYNKIFRRVNKQRLEQGKRPFIKIRELINDYDICDWKQKADSKKEFDIGKKQGYYYHYDDYEMYLRTFNSK